MSPSLAFKTPKLQDRVSNYNKSTILNLYEERNKFVQKPKMMK